MVSVGSTAILKAAPDLKEITASLVGEGEKWTILKESEMCHHRGRP